jgi:hypothetical protein
VTVNTSAEAEAEESSKVIPTSPQESPASPRSPPPKGDPVIAAVVIIAFLLLQIWLATDKLIMMFIPAALLVRDCSLTGILLYHSHLSTFS